MGTKERLSGNNGAAMKQGPSSSSRGARNNLMHTSTSSAVTEATTQVPDGSFRLSTST